MKSGMTASTFQQLEKILNNPKESGIDIDALIYVFTSPSFPYATIVGKVTDEDKLQASIEVMVKEQICQPIQEGDGYKFTILTGQNILAFNNSTAMLVSVAGSNLENTQKSISELMKQSAEKSILNNAGFQKMQKQKGDINVLASLDALPAPYAQQIKMGIANTNINGQDIKALGNLNFEKGKIAIQFEYYTENEEIKAMLKKQQKALIKLNTNLLKYFPSSTLAFLGVGANGEELYNLLQDNEEFRNYMSLTKADEMKGLFSSFNGDIAIGLLNVNLMKNTPTILAYADVKNGNALKALYDNQKSFLKKGEEIRKLGENEYVLQTKEMNLFFGLKDKLLYATNDEITYKSRGKAEEKSIKDTGYASDIKGKNFFFVINAEAILELPIVKMAVGFGGEEYQTYYQLASQISYLEISNVNDDVTEIDLILKNKETNALKQIVDFAKQFAGM